MGRIKFAFPALPVEFYDILCERLKEKGFDDARLSTVVNGVIDTCKYPTPTIAHFMMYDEELTCPFGFEFGKDHKIYGGCEECEIYNQKVWWRCKLKQIQKKND